MKWMAKQKAWIFLGILLLGMGMICGAAGEERIFLQGDQPYTIIFKDKFTADERFVYEALSEYLALDYSSDNAPISPLEVLAGNTNRPESKALMEGLGPHDWRIAVMNGKLVLAGGSDGALVNAAAALIRNPEMILFDERGASIAADYSLSFEGADSREEYIENIDLFLCRWALEFDPPAWMLDYEEKLASFRDPNGRMMAMHHRGDWIYYPENSIEGIISSVKMGADSIEVDPRRTRDGVLVLMHDETLQRTTDWKEKAGKGGLPESDKVADWSYEELQQLNLTDLGGMPTPYKIPTLQEAIRVCKERTILMLDKGDAWDWTEDVYPLIQEAEAWEICISNSYNCSGQQETIVDMIREDSGKEPVMLYGGFKMTNLADWEKRLNTVQERGYFPIVVWNDANKAFVKRAAASLETIRDKARILGWVQALAGFVENERNWDAYYKCGVNYVAVDAALEMQKYLAKNFTE